METIVVYSTHHSPRLKYALDWLLRERLQLDYRLTAEESDTKDQPFFISYGHALPNCISIPANGLLWEEGIKRHNVKSGMWNDLPTIFDGHGDGYTLPFDLLSAIFFLLSRYEEYYHYIPDKHGRYPPSHSILHKHGWLLRPLADEWVCAFRKKLQAGLGVPIPATPFLFQPTYDIDMAYSHLHKGVGRIVGAYMRAFLKGDVMQISERTQVLKNKQKDPYDSFRWLRQLHKQYDVKPIYFILAAFKTTAFDKNIHPEHPAMMRVIKNLSKDGTIGIHPSYYSDHDKKIGQEKQLVERIAGRSINISRQHYIKVKTPDTFRLLLSNGISEDYSMGYGSQLGFRAGTGNSFFWYDLLQEQISTLRVHPFCFMDTTAHFESKLTPAEAFERLNAMASILEKTGGSLITVFHNFSLGTGKEWKGWRQAYERFMQERSATVFKDDEVRI